MGSTRHGRILLAKAGLDGHDRGIKVVARTLRDAGLEVIYLGLHHSPEAIVAAAVQEDVDAIGLSVHSAAHMTLFKQVIRLLNDKGAGEIALFGGGIISEEDIRELRKIGVKGIFTPGTPLDEIVAFVKKVVTR